MEREDEERPREQQRGEARSGEALVRGGHTVGLHRAALLEISPFDNMAQVPWSLTDPNWGGGSAWVRRRAARPGSPSSPFARDTQTAHRLSSLSFLPPLTQMAQ